MHMAKMQNPNIEILELAVARLGALADEMVFLGGCATGLLISDRAAPPIRITQDVDAIVQVVSPAEYYQLAERLRQRGFQEDSSDGAPICRWVVDGVLLDVMPTEPKILGFGNEWYQPAMAHAQVVTLPSGRQIRMVSAPYFLITKLEAFDGRGQGDYLLSHDIEDIVTVLDGRKEIVEEVRGAEAELVQALAERFTALREDRRFIDAVSGHIPPDETSQARVVVVLERIEQLAKSR
jgi:predicted nucleotidyltransferase